MNLNFNSHFVNGYFRHFYNQLQNITPSHPQSQEGLNNIQTSLASSILNSKQTASLDFWKEHLEKLRPTIQSHRWPTIQRNFQLLLAAHYLNNRSAEIQNEYKQQLKELFGSFTAQDLQTPLIFDLIVTCMHSKNPFFIECLQECVPKIGNQTDQLGRSLWHYAFLSECKMVLEHLSKETLQNVKNPLNLAIQLQKWSIIEWLIEQNKLTYDQPVDQQPLWLHILFDQRAPLFLQEKLIKEVPTSHLTAQLLKQALNESHFNAAALLVKYGAPVENPANLTKVISYHLTNSTLDPPFIFALIKQKAFILIDNWEQPLINRLLYRFSSDDKKILFELIQQTFGITESMLNSVEQITTFLHPPYPFSSYQFLQNYPFIIENLKAWEKNGYPLPSTSLQLLENQFEKQKQLLESTEQWLKNLEHMPLHALKLPPTSYDVEAAFSLAFNHQKNDLLAKVILTDPLLEKKHLVDKPVFQFALDKTFYPPQTRLVEGSTLEGSYIYVQAYALAEAIQYLQLDPVLEKYQTNLELTSWKKLQDALYQACLMCGDWGYQLVAKHTSKTIPGDIIKQLHQLHIGEFILIPYGCKEHSTCLAVEKISTKDVKVSLFNTGDEIPLYHPQSEHALFQTYLSYEQVPLDDFIAHPFWHTTFSACYEQTSAEMYTHFFDLVKAGSLLPPSIYEDDYEQIQMQGTCSAQCLMAFMRYKLMSHPIGSKLHQYGIYKFLKAHLISHILNRRLEPLDLVLKDQASLQLHKLQTEISLIQSLHTVKEQRQVICECLITNGSEALAEQLLQLPIATAFEQFATLRKCHKALAFSLMQQPLQNIPKEIDTSYISSIIKQYHSHQHAIENYLDNLRSNEKWDEINQLMNQLRVFTKNISTLAQWATKILPQDPKDLSTHPFVQYWAHVFQDRPQQLVSFPLLQIMNISHPAILHTIQAIIEDDEEIVEWD